MKTDEALIADVNKGVKTAVTNAKNDKGVKTAVTNAKNDKEAKVKLKVVESLVSLIVAGTALTDAQLIDAKRVAVNCFIKVMNNEAFTPDEALIADYVNKGVKTAVTNAKNDKEAKEAKQAAEAKFEQELNAHKVEVNKLFGEWLSPLVIKYNATKKAKKFMFTNKAGVKECFDAFLATLPAQPKKPNAKTTSGKKTATTGSTADKKHLQDVTKLQEGSTMNIVWKAIVGSGTKGISKIDLGKALKVAKPTKTDDEVKIMLYKALYYLPEYLTAEGNFISAPVVTPTEKK